MKIGIVGSGHLASCLGPLWAAQGHRITYGVLDPTDPEVIRLVQRTGPSALAVLDRHLPALADVILLAVAWQDIPQVIADLGDLTGKILIDCTTPMLLASRTLLLGYDTSGAEQIAAMAVGVRVVKALDTAGVKTMANPDYAGVQASIFLCGDDLDAKAVVSELVRQIGFDIVDAGALAIARYIEPLAMLWVHLAFVEGYGEDIGFKLLRR